MPLRTVAPYACLVASCLFVHGPAAVAVAQQASSNEKRWLQDVDESMPRFFQDDAPKQASPFKVLDENMPRFFQDDALKRESPPKHAEPHPDDLRIEPKDVFGVLKETATTENIGRALLRGDREKVYRLSGEAIAAGRDLAEVYSLRSMAHLHDAHFDAAFDDANAALKIDPQHAIALLVRGLVNVRNDQLPRAIDDLTASLEQEESASTRLARAMVFVKQHERDRAYADIDRAIELEPHDIEALQTGWETCLAFDDDVRAVIYLDRAVALEPDNPQSYKRRSAYWISQGKFARGLLDAHLARALQESQEGAPAR